MGEHVTIQRYRYYRPFSHTFIGTVLWVLPGMLLLIIAGFLLARDYFAPKYLEPSDVRVSHLEPVRVLTPAEARLAASDEPSHVWTEGVKPSDIPRMVPADQPARPRRRTHAAPSGTPAPTATEATPAATTPATPAPPVTTPAPAPTPAPADTGGGDIPQD